MKLDAPDSVIFDELMAALYENHPIRFPILGTRESIRQITPELLTLCHRAFYHPENMLLCVIGDVDPEEVSRAALEVLGTQTWPRGEKRVDWEEAMTPVKPLTRRAMEVAMPTFSLAFKCEPTGTGSGAIRREMVADLASEVLFGESSELYLTLYEQGIIDSSFGGGFETVEGCAMLCVSGDSDHPLAVRDAIIAQAEKLCREGIRREDFLRLKRSALGRRIRALDSLDGTCFRVCAYHFGGFDYFRFPEVYRDIQEEDILEFLSRVARRERCAISIIDPLTRQEGEEGGKQ